MKDEKRDKRSRVSAIVLVSIVVIGGAISWLLSRDPDSPLYPYPAATPTPRLMPSPSPEASGTPYDYPTPTPYEDKLIAEARKQFGEGKIAFKPPEEMVVGKTETLEARITHQEQTASLEEDLKGRGKTIIKPLKVSCRMKVCAGHEHRSH